MPDLREVEARAGALNGHWGSLEHLLENKISKSKGPDTERKKKTCSHPPTPPIDTGEVLGQRDRIWKVG